MITFSDGTTMECSSCLYSAASGILRIRVSAPVVDVASVFTNPNKVSKITNEDGAVYVGFRMQAIIPEINCTRVNLARGEYDA